MQRCSIFAIYVHISKNFFFDFFKIEEEFDEDKFEFFLVEILKVAKTFFPNIIFSSLQLF